MSQKIQILHEGSLLKILIANHQSKPPMQPLYRICNSIHWFSIDLNIEIRVECWRDFCQLLSSFEMDWEKFDASPVPFIPCHRSSFILYVCIFFTTKLSWSLPVSRINQDTPNRRVWFFSKPVVFDALIKLTVSRHIIQYHHSGTIHARYVDLHLPRQGNAPYILIRDQRMHTKTSHKSDLPPNTT